MEPLTKLSDDQLLGKKERSEEPKGYSLRRAAGALGFSQHELDELDRLYRPDASDRVLDDGVKQSAKAD